MARAPRPELRSKRRSRRRQLALVCGALCYLAVFVAGLLALLSIFTDTGPAAVVALLIAAAFMTLALGFWAADAHARVHARPPTGVHIA